jgi:hypothetical protein
VDPRVTTTTSGQTPEALLQSPSAASVAGGGRGAARGSRPALKRRCSETRLRPPAPSDPKVASATRGLGERKEGFRLAPTPGWLATMAGVTGPRRRASARAEDGSPVWHHRVGTETVWILKGKQSPWKERVAGRWQRRLVTTDSSAEQSLEVGCFVRFRRARTSAHLGGCRRSATGNPRLRLWAPGGSLRAVDRDLSSATRGGSQLLWGVRLLLAASALRHWHSQSNFTRQRRELRPSTALCAR